MNNKKDDAQAVPTSSNEKNSTDSGIDAWTGVIPAYDSELLASAVPEGTEARRSSGLLQRWSPILVKFASVQLVVQVLGFAGGIIVVRNLPKPEYALYTLCNTMLATILLLADSGISSALTAVGGRIWQDTYRLSQLIRTALQLRRWMVLITLPVVIPSLVWLLVRNGANAPMTAILVAAVLLGCGFELMTRIYAVALRLKSEIRQIQNQALVGAFVKLAIVGIGVLLWFNVEIAIFAVVTGYAVQYWMLRLWNTNNLDGRAPGDPEMRSEILAVVKKQAPHTIYYCLQAQIIVWLISVFGNADRVADVGALGRLAVVFSILGAVTSEILFPAFARVQSAQMVRRRYLQIVFAYAAISGLLIGVVALFPGQVLAVLGSRYSHLHTEGLLMAVCSVLGTIEGLVWGLNATRAWIASPIMFITMDIAVLAVLVHFLNISTVRGVLELSIISTVPSIAFAVLYAFLRINRMHATA